MTLSYFKHQGYNYYCLKRKMRYWSTKWQPCCRVPTNWNVQVNVSYKLWHVLCILYVVVVTLCRLKSVYNHIQYNHIANPNVAVNKYTYGYCALFSHRMNSPVWEKNYLKAVQAFAKTWFGYFKFILLSLWLFIIQIEQ